MEYKDFTIRARDWNGGELNVEVTHSPVGEMRKPEVVTYEVKNLNGLLRAVDSKQVSLRELIDLGEELARILLPPSIRAMLLRSLAEVGKEKGVRLRLNLDDPAIANLPFEYLYLSPQGCEKGRGGFLALNPQTSIVRHEPIQSAPASVATKGQLKILAGFASPPNLPNLDLRKERQQLEDAIANVPGVKVEYVERLTIKDLEESLPGAHIFHFAGHGFFSPPGQKVSGARNAKLLQQGDEGSASMVVGQGRLELEGEHGERTQFDADRLGVMLRASQTRIAVLGACESGRRDGVNVWSGIAPALMSAEIPAAVAMQYRVYDKSAIDFMRRFYQSLAVGLSLDEAVVQGRLAIMNLESPYDLDFGVPVLYLRAPDGIVFPEITSDPTLESKRKGLRVEINQRVNTVKGRLRGLFAGEITNPEASISINQIVNAIEDGASVTGGEVDKVSGGNLSANQEAVEVDGSMEGLKIGKL